ncbi:FixH family protein [Solimicrobium silvestre]|uniref:FixH n=1 Tax=Solimicrobium silvestre TaxID=2099400 RepID=A0A2S9H0T5_9BURK|nr:FixH family protein [Solimicrobium silvestre]PRC93476.1 hypothetical protein S2091_1863 [Solimicrobium silvestre]
MRMTTPATPLIDRVNSLKPWYKHLWPWLLMAGPFLVVIAASYTGWIAFTRQDAMVVDDYYKQGNAINKDLRRDAAATNLGLTLNASYDAAQGKLHGRLLSFGQPIAGKVIIQLSHATQPEKDRQLEAQADQRGEFEAELPALDLGRWEMSVGDEKHTWRLTGTWMWPQQRTIDLKADLPAAE